MKTKKHLVYLVFYRFIPLFLAFSHSLSTTILQTSPLFKNVHSSFQIMTHGN
ncbi:hypothetical protein CRYPD_1345 [uncultured Candidatus Thioglobus sp.]|nr:hypothetical protein CRYPD_1345 [uncultured Candidatus Thioglobus sp.]